MHTERCITPPPTQEEPKTDDPRPTGGDGGDGGEQINLVNHK